MDANVSRITVTTKANQPLIEQVEKQLNKLINIIKVRNLSIEQAVKREMALIRVKANAQTRAEVLRIVDIFRCKVVDVGAEQYTIEVTGDKGKIEALLRLLKPIGIKEIARTGTVALYRDPK
jgi:acetolactate synthase-1/3 small subunit